MVPGARPKWLLGSDTLLTEENEVEETDHYLPIFEEKEDEDYNFPDFDLDDPTAQ